MSTFGGYSFPVLPVRRGLPWAGGYGDVTPTANAVRLQHYTAGVPPIHTTPPATSGDPFSVVQLAQDSQELVIQLKAGPALAQVDAWVRREPLNRIDIGAYITAPPQIMRATRVPVADTEAKREHELTFGVQFGPQPGLVTWLTDMEAILMNGLGDIAAPYAMIATWEAEAPTLPLLGPAALEDPTFTSIIVNLQKLAWTLRQVKRLRGLSLERRLLDTQAGSDWAWIFADEAGSAFGYGAGWVYRMRAVLAPPTALVAQQLQPVMDNTVKLQRRLQAARAADGRPPTPIVPPGALNYVPTILIAAGLAFGVYWLWARHRPGRRAAASSGASLDWGGPDLLRDVTPSARVVPSESFLPAVAFE
jgi:hypothetical protein